MVKTVIVKVASLLAAGACAAGMAGTAAAQETKIVLGMSGWTGFAPLTLADKAGIFKKNGLDVGLKMIPQKDRHLALASGSIQCAATTVETHVAWNANGVPIVQIFQMDKSYGADGLAVRNDVKGFADLKGKAIGVSAPGTAPYFGLAWMLNKNGMTMKDVKLVALFGPEHGIRGDVQDNMIETPHARDRRRNALTAASLITVYGGPTSARQGHAGGRQE